MKAKTRYARISAQKARLVADAIRGMAADKALNQLKFTPRKAAALFHALVASAVANAVNMYPGVDVDRLFIDKVYVDEGPTAKRWRPRAMGRAYPILKRSSHLTVELTERFK